MNRHDFLAILKLKILFLCFNRPKQLSERLKRLKKKTAASISISPSGLARLLFPTNPFQNPTTIIHITVL